MHHANVIILTLRENIKSIEFSTPGVKLEVKFGLLSDCDMSM